MTDETLPPEIQAELDAAEAESKAAVSVDKKFAQDANRIKADIGEGSVQNAPEASPTIDAQPGILSLADFRERVEICRLALVEEYRDGNVYIKFDVEARRGLLRPIGKKEEW